MPLTDDLEIVTSTNIKLATITPTDHNHPRYIAYSAIVKLKEVLEDAGWTCTATTAASGQVFVPGWVLAYQPTQFRPIWKPGGVQGSLPQEVPYNNPTNDDCPACDDGDCGTKANYFGHALSGCGNLCRSGCWRLGQCQNCDCKHTGCTEEDCAVHTNTDSNANPCFDDSGEYCNGHFSGDFSEFADAFVQPACDDPYEDQPYVASTATDGINIIVTATAPFLGPEFNAPDVKTAIGVGLAVSGGPYLDISGGGYIMRSAVNPTNGTQYSVTITQTNKGVISIRWETAEFLIRCGDHGFGLDPPIYLVIANPYQFIIFDKTNPNDLSNSFDFGGNTFLITSPWTNNPSVNNCVVAIGPGALLNKTTYTSGATSATLLNGSFYQNVGEDLRWWGLTARNLSLTAPLLTSNDKAIISNAWLFAPKDSSDEGAIVGKLWGGMIISKPQAHGSSAVFDGNQFFQISRQTSPMYSSLWVDGGSL